MACKVYILYSRSLDKFYKGQTYDLEDRLHRHNNKREKATATGAPWQLVWVTGKQSRSEGVIFEKKLKNLSRRKLIEFIYKYKQDIAGPDALLLLEQWSGCWPKRQHSSPVRTANKEISVNNYTTEVFLSNYFHNLLTFSLVYCLNLLLQYSYKKDSFFTA